MPCCCGVGDLLVAPHLPVAHGAMTFSSGASVATVASIRTWSLPLPVHPWAIVSALNARAASTASLASSGRPRLVKGG